MVTKVRFFCGKLAYSPEYVIIYIGNKVPNKAASAGKENSMNEMTDKQYDEAKETLILLILEMMKNSQNLDEAEEKVKALLPSKK